MRNCCQHVFPDLRILQKRGRWGGAVRRPSSGFVRLREEVAGDGERGKRGEEVLQARVPAAPEADSVSLDRLCHCRGTRRQTS